MKKNISIQQGSNFEMVVRWESKNVVFKAVTGITKTAPPVLTVAGHAVPDGWRVGLTNIKGMTALNATHAPLEDADYYQAKLIGVDALSLDGIDATGLATYTSGGILRYFSPIDLAGYTARMDIRSTLASTTVIFALTTGNTRIALNNVSKTITLAISAVDTALLTFTSGVYSLELVSGAGEVAQILNGTAKLIKEVTRP